MTAVGRRVGGAGALALVLASGVASAQTFEPFGRDPATDRYESSQNFALELRGGPFYPDTDTEFSGRSPLRDMFGSDSRVQFGVEFDWQALRLGVLGSLGVGIGAGYTSLSAVAPITQTPMPSDPAQWQRPSGGQETTLRVFPLYAVGVYRFDTIARRTVVPLVPYLKLGVSYSIWWVTNGDETARRTLALSPGASAGDSDLDQDAIGGSLGTHLAVGLMFRLDVLERRSQRSWDLDMGVNHSYVFAEYLRTDPGSLGSRPQLRLGVNTWVVGLAMEF